MSGFSNLNMNKNLRIIQSRKKENVTKMEVFHFGTFLYLNMGYYHTKIQVIYVLL